jgi:predicted nuclease of predicted toxin-antitoxin system
MRFLIDMPLSPQLAVFLRNEGHDATHAGEIGLAAAADDIIMDRALLEQRIVVTADLDYPRLLAASKASAPSLILFRGGNWSEQEVVDRMRQILVTFSALGLDNTILVVEADRVRRRTLPLP